LGGVTSTLLRLIEVLFDSTNLGISLLSEDFLNSWDNSCNMDNLLDENLDVRLEFFMSRVMNDLPVDVVWIKDSIYSEDRDKLLSLSVSNDLSS